MERKRENERKVGKGGEKRLTGCLLLVELVAGHLAAGGLGVRTA